MVCVFMGCDVAGRAGCFPSLVRCNLPTRTITKPASSVSSRCVSCVLHAPFLYFLLIQWPMLMCCAWLAVLG